MRQLIIRRLLGVIPVIIGMTMLTFFISHIIPSDPARLMAGPKASPEVVESYREKYGLNLPVWQQYLRYMAGVVKLDFGESFTTHRPVEQDLASYFPATMELTLGALLFAVIGGIGAGIISAVWKDSWADQITRFIAVSGISMPVFWFGLLAQLLFYQRLDWFPFGGRLSNDALVPATVTGMLTVDSLLAGNWETFFDALYHLILPAVILGFEPLAVLARISRTALVEVMGEPYIITARSKGLTEKVVYFIHALRNAMLPVVTMIGLLVGYLLGGAVLVEVVFAWPGMGRYAAKAILASDYNGIMGVTLVIALVYFFVNLIVDLLYARLDPRISYGES